MRDDGDSLFRAAYSDGEVIMVLGSLKWSYARGEGKVTFGAGWNDADWVVKADALVDWIAALNEAYESHLESGSKADHPAEKDER